MLDVLRIFESLQKDKNENIGLEEFTLLGKTKGFPKFDELCPPAKNLKTQHRLFFESIYKKALGVSEKDQNLKAITEYKCMGFLKFVEGLKILSLKIGKLLLPNGELVEEDSSYEANCFIVLVDILMSVENNLKA